MSVPSQEGPGGLDLVNNSKKEPPQEAKKSKIPTKTYIFDLKLGESNEETYPEFSWAELVRGAKTKERDSKVKAGTTILDPYASDDEDDLKAMAARFEQKYSSKGTNKNKRCRVEEFLDRGAGYDDNDSFIDNTDVYDEVVPPGVQAFHGGFYINSGSLEFKDVVLSDDEDTQDKKAKPNRKSGFPTPPYPKQTEDPKPANADSNDIPDYSKSSVSVKPSSSSDSVKLVGEAQEKQVDKSQNLLVKPQDINYQNQNVKEVESTNKDKCLSNPNSQSSIKSNLGTVKKVPRIIESSSSSSSSSSDDSSSSSDSDTSSSEEEDENQEEDNEKTKDRLKTKCATKDSVKPIVTEEKDKMPVLTPQQSHAKMIPPLPALNPAPIPQKRLKTKNVPPNPNLAKNKPPLTSSPIVTTTLSKGASTKNKELFLSSNPTRATSPNTNNGANTSIPRNQSPSGINLSYGVTSTPTSGVGIIKIPTPKSTPTPTSSPLGFGGPVYTSTNSSSQQQQQQQQLKSALPLNLLKPKPKPRKKIVHPAPATLTAEDIFNTLSGLNSIASANLLSQAGSSTSFLNKPIAKARLNKLASASTNSLVKGIPHAKKSQRSNNSGQFPPKSIKLKSKHGVSPLTNTNPLSNATSAAAMLAFTNNAANQIASLTSLSSFRPSPLASAVEITKLRPAHLSSSAATNPNSYKSLSQQLGTGITVTEVGDKIRSTISSSASTLATATPVSSGSGTFGGPSNNNGLMASTASANTSNNTIENSINSTINSSLTMNRLLQSITITPTPLLNLTTAGTSSDRNSTSGSSVSNFTSASRGFSSSSPASIQKPAKHITPYDVSALLGKMDPTINAVTGNINTTASNAMKASIEKIMLGNGLNPRDHQKK